MATTAAELIVSFGTKGANETKGAITDVGNAVTNTAARTKAGSAVLLGFGAAVVGGFGLAVKSAMSFEQGMSGVAAALGGVDVAGGITKETFRALDAEALRIGATTTQSATGAAGAMELLAKAGVDVEQILNGAAQGAVNLAEATGEALPQAASTMGSLLNLFSDVDPLRAVDVLTQVMNQSDATLSELQTGYARLAPTIAATNMPIEEGGALLAYFNAQGLGMAEVGTSLTRIFTDVTQPVGDAAGALADLGIQAYDTEGNFVGLPAIFDQVIAGTEGMTAAERDHALGMAFSDDAMDLINLAVNKRMEGYDALRASMDETGVAEEASRTRMNNLAGDMENLQGTMESISIVVGRMLTPALRVVTQRVASFLSGFLRMPPALQRTLAVLVGATAAVAGLAGAIGLLAAGGGPLIVGFGAIAAAVGIVLSPIGLLAAALVGLAIVFRGPLMAGISAVGKRIDEFTDIFVSSFKAFRGLDMNPIEAAWRALGDALWAFTGIDASAWFNDVANAVGTLWSALRDFDLPAAMGALGDLANLSIDATISVGRLIWGGIKEGVGNLWDWVKTQVLNAQGGPVGDQTGGPQPFGGPGTIDFGDVTVYVLNLLWGGIKNAVGDLWTWVKGKIMFGGLNAGDLTGGPQPFGAPQDIDVGDVVVKVASLAWGGIVSGLTSIRDFVRTQLGIGGDGDAAGMASRQLLGEGDAEPMSYTMPPVLVNVLGYVKGVIADVWDDVEGWIRAEDVHPVTVAPTVNVNEPSQVEDEPFWAAIDRRLEREVGLDIELQNWHVELKQIPGNLQVLDFVNFIDRSLEQLIGVDIDLQKWKVTMTGGGIVGIAPGVIDHIDRSLERMFAGGHKIELQNPIADWAGTVAGWFEPVYDVFEGAIDKILSLRNRITIALGGGDGDGGEGGVFARGVSTQLLGIPSEVEVPINAVPVITGSFEADLQEAATQAVLDAGVQPVQVSVPVSVQLEVEGMQRVREDAFGFWDPSQEATPGGVGPALTLMVNADTAPARSDFNALLEEMQAQEVSTTFSADTGPAAQAYTDVMSWGQIYADSTFTATYDVDHGPAAQKYTDAMGWGGIWEGSLFTSTLDIDNGPAAVAYTNAFSWGSIWDSMVFTASFSVDLSGLYAAVNVARWAAAEIAALMPHSPAKKGPLSVLPSFAYIADIARRDLAPLPGIIGGALSGVGTAGAYAFSGGPGGVRTTNHNSNVRIGTVVVRDGRDFERRILGNSRAQAYAQERR